MLPVAWTIFALCVVGSFITIAAYWLDVQDRTDLSFRQRVGWSLGILLFPVVIPAYAIFGGPGWPRPLLVGAFLPAVALAMAGGFAIGVFG